MKLINCFLYSTLIVYFFVASVISIRVRQSDSAVPSKPEENKVTTEKDQAKKEPTTKKEEAKVEKPVEVKNVEAEKTEKKKEKKAERKEENKEEKKEEKNVEVKKEEKKVEKKEEKKAEVKKEEKKEEKKVEVKNVEKKEEKKVEEKKEVKKEVKTEDKKVEDKKTVEPANRSAQANGPVVDKSGGRPTITYGGLSRKEDITDKKEQKATVPEKKEAKPVEPKVKENETNGPVQRLIEADVKPSVVEKPVEPTHSYTYTHGTQINAKNLEKPVIKGHAQIAAERSVSKNENFHKMSNSNSEYQQQTNFVKYLRKDNPHLNPKIPPSFQPVEIVKEISDAGKAALAAQESKGEQYFKIQDKGFEPAVMANSVYKNYSTTTLRASAVNNLWNHPPGENDANLWQNIEYNRYGNNIQGMAPIVAPAKFSVDEYGSPRVTAPAGAGLEMQGRATTLYTMGANMRFMETNSEAENSNKSTTTFTATALAKVNLPSLDSMKRDSHYDDDHTGFRVIDTDKEDIFAKYSLDGETF